MKFYYTWHDIERELLLAFPDKWHDKWVDIDVYADELVIYVKPEFTDEDRQSSVQKLKDILGSHFLPKENNIVLDYGEETLNVNFEETETVAKKTDLPLFRELKKQLFDPKPLKGVPVIAFHSYKGGVGRTLSLISTLRSLSKLKDSDGQPYRVLLVDGDMEAPGLTWLSEDKGVQCDISLLDALAIIHQNDDWREIAIPFVKRKIEETVLSVPIEGQEIEHYFLPAYRGDDQLMSMPVTPETVVQMNEREWVIADFLSELGQLLQVKAVLVDLRAGISEFSAPLLFDPRVQKVFVTSTSLQSVKGLCALLKHIYHVPLSEKYPAPVVLVNMVIDELKQKELSDIEERINEAYSYSLQVDENGQDVPDILPVKTEFLPFISGLIHLQGFKEIDSRLALAQDLEKRIDSMVAEWFVSGTEIHSALEFTSAGVSSFLDSLVMYAERMEHAETTLVSDFLTTASLKNITRKYRYNVPSVVIIGGKGSGKTFAYLNIMRSKVWEKFVGKVEGEVDQSIETFVVPFLMPKNMPSEAVTEISNTIDHLIGKTGFKMTVQDLYSRNDTIENHIKNSIADTEAEWKDFWRDLLLGSTGIGVKSFDELQNYLALKNCRIVFIIDGLEEVLQNVSRSSREKVAVRALCQGVVNEIRSFLGGRIGIIVFLRRDLAVNAIEQNLTQFLAQYSAYELNWTQVEALRLALWLASSVNPELKPSQVSVENATEEVLVESLYPLWGIKLGKPESREAYSASWIITVLSDLNGQLQARDIIRFLKYAAKESMKAQPSDRYLTPSAIRNAVHPCSEQKITDIRKEMPYMGDIFDKLTSRNEDQRYLPFQLEDYNFTFEDVKIMEQHGYLVKMDDGYYMPEIIRRGLDFTLQSRARPKVFSLLKRAQRRK